MTAGRPVAIPFCTAFGNSFEGKPLSRRILICNMKIVRFVSTIVLAACFALSPFSGAAADAKKAKPYTLKTCAVSDEKLGGMGDPYTFVHDGREVKLCCKGCLKDFKKDPAKYLKKVDEAEAKAAKKNS